MTTDELYRRIDGHAQLAPFLDASDEDVLTRLARPALIRLPGSDPAPAARWVSCLLHGNEDSGYRAVLALLRQQTTFPFDLWVFIGNVRAAHTDGWFAHRYLDGQEDFNRVWRLDEPTTRMRRCADAVMAELPRLDAAVDLHNNTGHNPPYAVMPRTTNSIRSLAGLCVDTAVIWKLRAHTLMEALAEGCPAVAVECGQPGRDEATAFAAGVLDRFLSATALDGPPPPVVYELRSRVIVRPEVPFAFGGVLSDDVDFVLTPGLDGHNFGLLAAGTRIGTIHPGAALPLIATDMQGHDVTQRYFAVDGQGGVSVAEDLTPTMMTTTVDQTRRDCLFYVARRC